MILDFSPLTMPQFLRQYWQQQPVVLKGALNDFVDPVSADELAGLAAEANIESRVIYHHAGSWQADSGPFDNYDRFGDKDWTLVVQSVNHWLPAAQDFARLFTAIPQWRFDDVMVSFAAPGGGVGAHVDNYDVFICQGSGRRRWRVGACGDFSEFLAHEKLRHVRPFDAIIDEVLEAGDILYIPPGYPHEGVSIGQSMSFSVGYKSTNATELLSGFADYLIDFDSSPRLLSDKNRQPSRYGQVDVADVARLKTLLQETLNDEEKLSDFIGIHYSQSLSELDLAQDDDDFEEWLAQFTQSPLHKLYALKTLYVEPSIEDGVFYVDGERHQLNTTPELLRQLCDDDQISISDINAYADSEAVLHWLWQSTNRGYWYFS